MAQKKRSRVRRKYWSFLDRYGDLRIWVWICLRSLMLLCSLIKREIVFLRVSRWVSFIFPAYGSIHISATYEVNQDLNNTTLHLLCPSLWLCFSGDWRNAREVKVMSPYFWGRGVLMVIFIVTINKKNFLKIWRYFHSILALFREFQGRSLDRSGSSSRIIRGIIVGVGCYSAQSIHQAIMTSFKHFLPNLSIFQRTKIS
jgi:hypothetical protein